MPFKRPCQRANARGSSLCLHATTRVTRVCASDSTFDRVSAMEKENVESSEAEGRTKRTSKKRNEALLRNCS